jgi:hypothetical protein
MFYIAMQLLPKTIMAMNAYIVETGTALGFKLCDLM